MLKRLQKFFSKLPNKERFESMLDGRYQIWENWKTEDDLQIHHELDQKEIFREFIYIINKKKNFQSSHRNIGTLMYFMGMHNLRSVYVLNTVEDEMDLYRDKFSARTAFGFYCGALNLSAQKHYIHFAKQEYLNKLSEVLSEFALQEIKETTQALRKNENLTKEEKAEMWLELHQNLIQNNLELLKKDFSTCLDILKTMYDIDLFDQDLFVQISNVCLENEDCKEFENIVNLHQFYRKFKNETNNFEGLKDEHIQQLEKIENQIKNEEDFIWRYDVEKNQLRTYRELYDQRDRNLYQNQLAQMIPEDLCSLEEMREFKREVLDNPKVMGYDYDNLQQYIDAPWGDEDDEQNYLDEDEEQIRTDLDSDVTVDEDGNIIRLEQLTFQ